MKKILPIGYSDFRELREAGYYYVDKSMFIKETLGTGAKVLLIPRPRRFGKTLNLSMLRYFFEKSDEDRRALFDGLKIRNDEVFEKHQGKYPVIFLTFKDLKDLTWDSVFRGLTNILRDEFLRHRTILQSDILSEPERIYFESVVNSKADPRDYADVLRYLSAWLHRYYKEKAVILIDEYDTPIHAGYFHGYYEEIISFMRNFLSGGFKDNEHLFRGVITGILRVAKESVFSGLNNLGVHTLLSPKFSDAFGFTETEVRTLLDYCDMGSLYEDVSHWYNGYRFGNTVIYNPWSVANYVGNSGDAKPYWINTASTELIDSLATKGGTELREEVGQLLEGSTITKPVYDSIVMKDLEKQDDLLWSFLMFSGYLETEKQADDETCHLKIPNHEVKIIYRNLIRRWFAEKTESNQLEEMLKALETGDMFLFERMLRTIVSQVMSYHDLAGSPEKVYHALVLGMLVWLSGKYEIRSNRESGYGRYDIMLKPKDLKKQGIVIEFKKVFKDETPEDILKDALKQIEDRKYETELEAAGVKDILKIAVAFRGKELWVKTG